MRRSRRKVEPGSPYYEDVILPLEAIFDGTWGSQSVPGEVIDAILMAEFHWSWADLRATPSYVRRVCMDYLQTKFAAEADQVDRTRRHQPAGG